MNLEFVPSIVVKRVFVAAVTLSLTASPSLSGLLCGGSHKAKAEQTVVAHLDEGDGSEGMSGPTGAGEAGSRHDAGSHEHTSSDN